jgi:hypothetical protein
VAFDHDVGRTDRDKRWRHPLEDLYAACDGNPGELQRVVQNPARSRPCTAELLAPWSSR